MTSLRAPAGARGQGRRVGEGSIRARRDGRWEARYWSAEKGRQCSVYADSEREATVKLREALSAQDQGRVLPSGRDTVATFLREWVEGVKPELRVGTWERYESVLRLHVVPHIGKVKLAALGPQHVARLYRDLTAAGMSAGSVRAVHRVLRRALGQAERWRLLPSNPAALVRPPRAVRHDMVTLTAEQAKRLLDAAQERDRTFYLLAVSTGMRLGELLALRWSDVDLDTRALRVVRTVRRVHGEGDVFGEPKTTRSRRRIELGDDLVTALSAQRVRVIEEGWKAANLWKDGDLVFPSLLGTPRNPSNVARSFHEALTRAGLPRIRFHDLRHSAATLLLGQGVHPKVVSEMLGHASIGITLDTYSHVLPTMQRDAAEVMGGLLR